MMFRVCLMLCVGILGFASKGFSETQDTTAMKSEKQQNPIVLLKTSMGSIKIELYPDKAPETVENFLDYVRSHHYDETIFHRVIDGFMIQGGGFTVDLKQKPTNSPIPLESDNGLKNVRGTVAMARTSDPNSATSQFFINLANNGFLDYKSKTPQGFGYAVFGKVISGMDVVDKIAKVKTGSYGPHQNVPLEPVIITEATEETANNETPSSENTQAK